MHRTYRLEKSAAPLRSLHGRIELLALAAALVTSACNTGTVAGDAGGSGATSQSGGSGPNVGNAGSINSGGGNGPSAGGSTSTGGVAGGGGVNATAGGTTSNGGTPVLGGAGGGTSSGGGNGNLGGGVAGASATVTLPMVVDSFFFVSGYTGEGATGRVTEKTSCPLRGGKQRGDCHAFNWHPTDNGWVNVFWQYPGANFGKDGRLGRAIPAGAKSMSFYAWGKQGGEAISFGAGLGGADKFAIVSPPITLTNTPKQYTLPLEDITYGNSVISGFMWAANQGVASADVAFFVDDIIWDTAPVPKRSPDWPQGPTAQGVSLRVRNQCSFPLWVSGTGAGGTLAKVRLDMGQIQNYDAPKVWSAARLNAFKNEGDAEPLEKAELTFFDDGKTHVSYNVTYVDWVGLPLEITAHGGECNEASATTGCYAKQANLASACPESFLKSGDRCVSARSYCADPGNQGQAYCKALDGAINSCASCPKATTSQVYACSGPYANEPRWCAALNRAMTGSPDDPDATHYYKSAPFNSYSKWVHDVCPGIYAFSYDDWKGHGGYRSCTGGNEVRITFCPAG